MILAPDEAAPGMVLAAAVPHPNRSGQDLLKRGFVLDRAMLSRLRELGVAALYVDYPDLAELDRHVTPLSSPARVRMYEHVRQTFAHAAHNTRFEPDFSAYYACVRELVVTLTSQGQHPVYLDALAGLGKDIVGHSASVTHLSLLLGLKLQRYVIGERHRLPVAHAREIVNLGVAAMLHDIGKTRLPPALHTFHALQPPGDPDANAEWQNHARLGYELIRHGVEPSAANAVLHHHQTFDGTGFPNLELRGQSVTWAGKKVHIFARILAAADTFDRIANATDPTRRLTNLEALHLLRTHHSGKLDGVILRALHSVAPPFPPGTRVILSDNSSAIVTSVPEDDPCHPTVRRLDRGAGLSDAHPFTLVGAPIDLRQSSVLTIACLGPISARGLTATPADLEALATEKPEAIPATPLAA